MTLYCSGSSWFNSVDIIQIRKRNKTVKTASPFRSPNTSDLQCKSLNFVVLYYNIKTKSAQHDNFFFDVKLYNFLTVSQTPNVEIYFCTESKAGLFIVAFFFPFSSCQDEWLFMIRLWIHFDVAICCRCELRNYNFLVKFRVTFVAIKELVTFGFLINILFFQSFSDYLTESLALLACQRKTPISIAFFYLRLCDSMRYK